MEEGSLLSSLLAQHKVPIIDIAHITKDLVYPVKTCTRQAAQKLHRALSDLGYAFLVNHGITEHKLQGAYCKFDTFCSLGEEKRRLGGGGSPNRYFPPADKLAGKLEDYKHVLTMRDLEGEQLPEDEVPGFTSSVASLLDDFKSLAAVLLQLIAIGCEVEGDYFLGEHRLMAGGADSFELTFFPPMEERTRSGEASLPPASLGGTFAISSQDAEVGLQVMSGNKWTSVGYLPGSLFLRAGLCLQEWTDGLYKTAQFRMVVPDDCSVLSRSRHLAVLHIWPSNASKLEPVSLAGNDFYTYYPIEEKSYCSLRRAYIYIRRRMQQLCR